MTSHELARKLLELPDLPVATHAKNHTYAEREESRLAGCPTKVGLFRSYAGNHIIIGDITRRNLAGPNGRIVQMYVGDAPEDWPRLEAVTTHRFVK